MKITRRSITDVVIPILEIGAVKAVKFLDEKTRVKATRRLVGGKIRRRYLNIEILLTIGFPNYQERRMIRNALKKDKGFLKNRSLVIFPYKMKEK